MNHIILLAKGNNISLFANLHAAPVHSQRIPKERYTLGTGSPKNPGCQKRLVRFLKSSAPSSIFFPLKQCLLCHPRGRWALAYLHQDQRLQSSLNSVLKAAASEKWWEFCKCQEVRLKIQDGKKDTSWYFNLNPGVKNSQIHFLEVSMLSKQNLKYRVCPVAVSRTEAM